MRRFIDGPMCKGGTFCVACRDREGGRATRAGLVQLAIAGRLALPAGEPPEDFECPAERGKKPWGWKPSAPMPAKSRGLGDTVAKVIKAVTLGNVKPCGGCQKRQAALNKLIPYGPSG